jgi:hypothetical protein
MNRTPFALLLVMTILPPHAWGDDQPVGARPYEMQWAGRTADNHPPLVDFENLDGWTVDGRHAAATFVRSRQQQLWGRYVGQLAYRASGTSPLVSIKPPRPIEIPAAFDCVNFWVYGNNWAWVVDPDTPPVQIGVVFRAHDGRPVRVALGTVRWREWWVMHRRLSAEQQEMLRAGAALEAIEVANGRNREDRLLYFDNLSVYREALPPLEYLPRPQRGITPWEGQSCGLNTGPGKLPFPTREETILPDNLTTEYQTRLEASGNGFAFHYRGRDGRLDYAYRPATGTLGDITAAWQGAGAEGGHGPFQPLADGGVYFVAREGEPPVAPERAELVRCAQQGDAVVAVWRVTAAGCSAEVVYTLRLWQKSLVIDTKCLGGRVGEFRVGRAVGVKNPRLVTIPFLACEAHRPAVLVDGPPAQPLFTLALIDHCRSNASALWAVNRAAADGVAYNGGTRYSPKTDGRRNDCFERLFLTISPRFEEVLPNVPNPKSPWMHVTGQRVWRAHGASVRERDYQQWKTFARYNMSNVLITDHETGWRDGGESFTLRTRAAPGKGGDAGQEEYARKIRALGFVYGIYNNYTDFAPVNEFWNEDYVTRQSDGDWHPAWARCYNLKPSRAVELEARLAPVIQNKFHLNTAYCDVHTAVTPWNYCDYDARVPGAGTFAATFYAYGEIMLHQKRTWGGPVYSEGNNHWYYCGLTDGNYGQDQQAHLAENPWLVDFDLLKLHPLCCNFGMGNPEMFFGRSRGVHFSAQEAEARLDHFLAATLAFGHTGFLVTEGGIEHTVRSYFLLQQVHARYAQEKALQIRYADQQGRLLETSAAVAGGALGRSQIVTRYSGGLEVTVNGHATENWATPGGLLPPYGWCVKDARGQLLARSTLVDGHRADYVDSPAYLYADGRGRFTRLEHKAACDGPMIVTWRDDGTAELIPVGRCSSFGVALGGRSATALALDEDRRPLGPAEVRTARGLVYVMPVKKAFSYLLKPVAATGVTLKADREEVVPGETVTIAGRSPHSFTVPRDARPGTRLWQTHEGAWLDFTVVPLVDAELRLDRALALTLTSHLSAPATAQVVLGRRSRAVMLVPRESLKIEFPWTRPHEKEVRRLPLAVMAGPLQFKREWWLKSAASIVAVAAMPEEFEPGECLRHGAERPLGEASGAQVARRESTCGGVSQRGIFMHPPYRGGVGYSYAQFGPIDLPGEPRAALRCQIGKADGSDPGDGILFRIAVVDSSGLQTIVAEKSWIQHAWTPLEADLSRWAGRKIKLKLIADVGPHDNSSGDWACWSELRVESREPELQTTLHDRL